MFSMNLGSYILRIATFSGATIGIKTGFLNSNPCVQFPHKSAY